MPEYRPVTDEEADRYNAIAAQAFEPEAGPVESVPDDAWPQELSDPRGLFVDGELVAICKRYYLDATVRGEWTEIGGLGSVATPPEHRRRGYSRELLREALREYREEGVDLVALWPSTTRFYRGLGWGSLDWYAADAPPEQVGGAGTPLDPDRDRVRQLDVGDWERLRAVEVARAERYGLSLRRTGAWWRRRTLAAWPGDTEPFVYGYERDGDLRGYAILEVDASGDERRLEVRDVAGVDFGVERSLLSVLGDFDSQVGTVRIRGPLARDLLDLVPDPREIEVEKPRGPMVRLADVERGLAGLDWPSGAEVDVVVDVDDPLLDRNDRRFRIDVAGGEATVESVATGADDEVDATVDVGTLSRLAVGAIGVGRAERVAGLSVEVGAVHRTLADAFPPEPVCLREFF